MTQRPYGSKQSSSGRYRREKLIKRAADEFGVHPPRAEVAVINKNCGPWKAPVKEGVWGLSSRRSFWPNSRAQAEAHRASYTSLPDPRRRCRTCWPVSTSVVPRPRRTERCDRTCEEVRPSDEVSARTSADPVRFSLKVRHALKDSVRAFEASGPPLVIGAAACEACEVASPRFLPSKLGIFGRSSTAQS